MYQQIKTKIALTITVAACCYGYSSSAQIKLSADNIDQVVSEMTLEEKCHFVLGTGMGFNRDVKFPGTAGATYAIPRLGIPAIYCADGQQGLRMNAHRDFDSRDYFPTDFLASMTLASTWDAKAAYQIGKAIGNEVKEFGLDWILAPSMNLMRSPLCGRNHEYYSEDPLLSGWMAGEYVKGIQSEGTLACVKHFVANNQETNRNNNDSRLSQRALRELYLRQFEIALRVGSPWTLMTSYNKVNGIYTAEDKGLLTDVLRNDWGYEGFVVSDWNAGRDAVASMLAGNDMMQPGQDRQYQAIYEAVKEGRLPMEVLDRNVRRILRVLVKTHSFARYPYSNEPDLKAHDRIVRDVAAEGMVLLKNDSHALPLLAGRRVALFGCTSYDIISGGSGFGGTSVGHYTVSLVEGLRNAGYSVDKDLLNLYKLHLAQENKRLFPNGRPSFSLTPPARAEEMEISQNRMDSTIQATDVALITIGRKSGEAADRNKADFYLKEGEKQLIRQVCEAYHRAGKKVVVLLDICSPIDVASWRDQADAVVCTWQGGQEIGNSIADVLSGKVNPSGKLPMTFMLNYGDAYADRNFPAEVDDKTMGSMFMWGYNPEKAPKDRKPIKDIDYTCYDEDIYVGYRYFDSFGKAVAYPFGFGLSYTQFDYGNMTVSEEQGKYVVAVDVKNVGSVAGKNVVELFVAAPNSRKANKPAKELRAFAKTALLQPGQSEHVVMTVAGADLASFDAHSSSWITDAGTYRFLVCSSADKVEAQASAKVKAYKRRVSDVMRPQVKLNLLKR